MLILLYCIIEKDTVHFGININFSCIYILFSGKLHFIHIFIAKTLLVENYLINFYFLKRAFLVASSSLY